MNGTDAPNQASEYVGPIPPTYAHRLVLLAGLDPLVDVDRLLAVAVERLVGPIVELLFLLVGELISVFGLAHTHRSGSPRQKHSAIFG